MKCSACSGRLKPITATDLKTRPALYECVRCGGVHGTVYRGDATTLFGIGLSMAAQCADEFLRYFDVTVLGSTGVERVHGWYDSSRNRVVQYG